LLRKKNYFQKYCLFILFCIFGATLLSAQIAKQIYSGDVMGPTHQPVAGASVSLQVGRHVLQTVADANGSFSLATNLSGMAVITIKAPGFAPLQQAIFPAQPLHATLQLATNTQRVVVTASRTLLSLEDSPAMVQTVSGTDLRQSGALTFGDQIRQVTGVEPFRRSSYLVANPTAEGVSLRGLGSTAASRTLVLADGLSILDPFGGWVYWNQVPSLAIERVEVVNGGVSNLYGSSAIGGVINVLERTPESFGYVVDAGYGQENTPHGSVLGTAARGPWSGLAAADWLRTDGYIQTAPNARGPIDTASNVHYQNGELLLRRTFASSAVGFLRGNVLNQARGNGTPLQTNATRLWRYVGGVDWTAENAGLFMLRVFGTQEHYRQSFSSISAARNSEALTRRQNVPTQQIAASLQWSKPLLPSFTLVAGADVNDVRATDYEVPIAQGKPNGLSDTSARQRDAGEYAEGLWQPHGWTVIGSVRGDNFLNLDAVQNLQTGTGPIQRVKIPNRSEGILSARVGVVRQLDRWVTARASAYRAFRSPTINELYRQFQVGQKITLANPNLQSERATGWEMGTDFHLPGRNSLFQNSLLRATYFWTAVNRPVSALTISSTPTKIVQRRENLGQIESRGVALDYQTNPLPWLSVNGGYQYADATVTKFAQNPSLVGKWIPEVAHNMATMQVSATKTGWGFARVLGTLSGRQYDDDQNAFLLHGYFQLDAYVSHAFSPRMEVYGAVNNIFDRAIDTGRTPILTLGTPRMASFGLRIHSADVR
jgi:outer membrane receptor protein involved in Fe transport